MKENNDEKFLVEYLIINRNLDSILEIQDNLTDNDKKTIISKLDDLKSIEFGLMNFKFLTKEDRRILIEKVDRLYDLLCDIKNNLDKDEVSYIINILIDKNDFDSIMNIIKNLNHLLRDSDINNIVNFYLTKSTEVWDLVTLINELRFQLSEKKITEIINNICDRNCISALICILENFNNIITRHDIMNIVNTIFKLDSTGAYIPQMINLINFSLLSDDDIKSIIDKICALNNESCISDSLINISKKLDYNSVNYLVKKLDETSKLNTRVCNILLTMYIEKLSSVSISIIVKSVCMIGSDRDIVFISSKLKNLIDNDDVTEIINTICKKKPPCSILEIARILKYYLSSDNIKLCANTLCEIKNIKFLYEFLLEFNNKLDEKTKLQIKQAILQSMEYKYIILLAVLIDISLISMLFEKIDDLYIFIITSGLFTIEEISLIKEKLNINTVEPNVDKAVKSLKNINEEIK